MLYHNVRVMAHLLRFVDAGAIALTSAVIWYAGVKLHAWPMRSTWNAAAVFTGVAFVAFVLLAERMHIYHARRTEHIVHELIVLSEVALYATALACVSCQVFTNGMPGSAYVVLLFAGFSALIGLRMTMRVTMWRLRRKGSDYRVWLIVGHNSRAMRIAESVVGNPHFGIHIDEIVDVVVGGAPELPLPNFVSGPLSQLKFCVVRDVESIREILATRVIDEVVITLPVRSQYDTIQQILDMCREAGISVRVPPEAFERSGYRADVSSVGDIAMVTHFSGPSNYANLVVKRLIDVLSASAGLVFLSPAFALIAAAIKLSSPGPIFFLQTRVGLHGRHFRMVKFRSMVQDAPVRQIELHRLKDTDGLAFKLKDDPRIIPVGRVLRRFHLDEMPQMWNVLLGDMSLVGPRPLPPGEAHGDQWWQRRRLSMPPGLTCFWQVAGDHKMAFQHWMRLDLAYIDNWSVWLDIKLIASTVGTVARGKGW
jgi:exopolysaccharide biosynthesis polyprenyl glycosylphosphotransferase